ncbi:hypothetical protein [Thiomicrospira sp. ALE5]|uniref:hypothetical protein n=1 Tax=Thiomicrospira sp. ALE5 TaxID=748650 RepID=UPI0008EE8F0B|nr:hypothetical protein [Thiomicrospira sp. ALE5]SFR56390.1 hypothetical protein SAMN03092900_1266 [Thiomicrospira sp. ALE5]
MNEPITPKAEHHVVKGEFVETDSAADTSKSKESARRQTKAKALLRNTKQPWLAMLAMIGVLLGATSWVALEQRTAALYEMAHAGLAADALVEQQLEQQMAPLLQKIAYQQQKITVLENWQQSFQGGARSFLRDYETLEGQLTEMQALLSEHATQLAKLSEQTDHLSHALPDSSLNNQAPAAPVPPETEAVQAEMQAALGHLNNELAEAQQQLDQGLDQLRAEIQNVQRQADQALSGLQKLTNDPQWQAGQAELAEQLETFQQRLAELANEQAQWQADWLAKLAPEVEDIVTELTPTFEGLLSRFNSLFTLKKIEQDKDENASDEQGVTP